MRACTHHKIAQHALYAEVDVAAGVDCTALRAGLQAKLAPNPNPDPDPDPDPHANAKPNAKP